MAPCCNGLRKLPHVENVTRCVLSHDVFTEVLLAIADLLVVIEI